MVLSMHLSWFSRESRIPSYNTLILLCFSMLKLWSIRSPADLARVRERCAGASAQSYPQDLWGASYRLNAFSYSAPGTR